MPKNPLYKFIKLDNFTFLIIMLILIVFTIIDRNIFDITLNSAILVYGIAIMSTLFMLVWILKNGLNYDKRIKVILFLVIYLMFLLIYSINSSDIDGLLYIVRLYVFISILYLFSFMKLDNIKIIILSILFSIIVIFNFLHFLFYFHTNKFPGVFDNPNTLAYMSFITMFFLILLINLTKHKVLNLIMILMSLLNLIVIYATTSRAVWLSALIGAIVYVPYKNLKISYRFHQFIFAILIWTIFSFTYIYPQLYGTSIGNTINYYLKEYTGKGLFSGREKIFQDLFSLIEQNMILGHGVSAYPTTYLYVGQGAHNTYMSILFQTGIVGLSLYVALLYVIWQGLYNHFRNNISSLFIAFFSSLIVYQGFELALVQGPFSIRNFEWLIIGLGLTFSDGTYLSKKENSP